MRISIMTSTIIICFVLTILSILTINSYTTTKIEQQETLNNVVDASIKAMELDEVINEGNYEEMVNNLLQLVIIQSHTKGNINIKIIDANLQEGLLDVEVTKSYKWFGITKVVASRRTVIMDEYDHPPATPVVVKFIYSDSVGSKVIWREDNTFTGALLRRPKNPKKQGFRFKGWSTISETGIIISDEEWQNYIIPDEITSMTFYAVFERIE